MTAKVEEDEDVRRTMSNRIIGNSGFNLEKRLDWVQKSLSEHSFALMAEPICCPVCEKGKLEIDSETYVSPYLE